ncbi:TIR domain-containing protein [Tumebacillus sp. ITR2]|uniref:TIR domain-containing protein n=1 Tax=Tumebacillus amylolyticus TaxID=2801339 RepID=A0ABS1JGW4_9BACL|nr:TIR domain-containing protein [Tumebacillus amylolyticus]MBL0389487.1 TIR domain-containing protein [Tumebacillus amylolyticus]
MSDVPALKTYDIFISHAWKYNKGYYRLLSLLDGARLFQYANHSVPQEAPLFDTKTPAGDRKLKNALEKQIGSAKCLIVLSGMYVAHRKWLKLEMELAQKHGIPIIGVVPRGQQRVPLEVKQAAVTMVSWNTRSIVTAIRKRSL